MIYFHGPQPATHLESLEKPSREQISPAGARINEPLSPGRYNLYERVHSDRVQVERDDPRLFADKHCQAYAKHCGPGDGAIFMQMSSFRWLYYPLILEISPGSAGTAREDRTKNGP